MRKDLINSLLVLDVEKEAQSRTMMGSSYTAGVSRGAGTRTELSMFTVWSIIQLHLTEKWRQRPKGVSG